ncbi:MAG TPA: hypothetical protein PLN24_05990 [Victivallales bacterium]|nr:hypothetical protein [Victivallales bacterium]HPO91155.1 hypothetical protein [Victivallales bacterium]
MKKKGKVLIIYNEPERCEIRNDFEAESSVIDSALSISECLSEIGYSCKIIPLSFPLKRFFDIVDEMKPDFIFNLCEGFRGNPKLEMNIAALLELLYIPYTGCSAKTLLLAQDKEKAKIIVKKNDILTPEFQTIFCPEDKINIDFPIFLKPPFEDGSIGISEKSYVRNYKEFKIQTKNLIARFGKPVLAEKYIDGREFNVAIFGNKNEIRVLPPAEIVFKDFPSNKAKIVSYEAKWKENTKFYRNTESHCPAEIPDYISKKLMSLGRKIYKIFEADSYARVDFRLNAKEEIYFLEFNPNPDISPNAGFRKALLAANIDFASFAELLLKISKWRRRR